MHKAVYGHCSSVSNHVIDPQVTNQMKRSTRILYLLPSILCSHSSTQATCLHPSNCTFDCFPESYILFLCGLIYSNQQMKALMGLMWLLLGVLCSRGNQPVYTQVTCMYDIKRGEIGIYKRTFEAYLKFFGQLLMADNNLIIFGDKQLQEYVWQRRKPHNTVFILREIEQFRKLWFYPLVQKLRKEVPQRPGFALQLHDHPAFKLQYYNMLMFGKLFVLEEALQYDKFNSDFFVWTDAGLTHVFSEQEKMMYPEDHLIKWFTFIQPQWLFLSTTYGLVFQGFANGSYPYVGLDVEEVILGGFFGGYVEMVRDARCTYQNFLRIMLQNGDMNSDESTYLMLPYRYPYLFPISTSSWFDYLYKKLHVFMNSNRKQEHHRYFRTGLDSQGNLMAIDRQILTKLMVDAREYTFKKQPQPSAIQLLYYRQTYRLYAVLGGNLMMIRQIFLRELACLAVLAAVYAFARLGRRQQAKIDQRSIN